MKADYINIRSWGYLMIIALFASNTNVLAQTEVMGWGNLQGIRVQGELIEFNTSICVTDSAGVIIARTGKEKQERPIYARSGSQQILTTRIDSLFITQWVDDTGVGTATLRVQIDSRDAASYGGVFLCIELPSRHFSPEHIQTTTSGINANSETRNVRVLIRETATVSVVPDEQSNNPVIFVGMLNGPLTEDTIVENTFDFEVSGTIDRNPVSISVDPTTPGRPFLGFGGNFRLQNPRFDPPVIDYNIENMRVAMTRLQMRWWNWHPDESSDPIEEARSGSLHPAVEAELELARRFARKDIPVLLAVWTAPEWAILGERLWGTGPNGERGNALNPEKAEQIYGSIADYIEFLKTDYGVEVEYFSFNESDLGINVRQTGAEHATFIKGLGAHLASRGLRTKLLLGDTADANGWWFLKEAMEDPETHKYIGAVSFHSWRGWDYETLEKWDDAARAMNVPLIVGEGSTDAAAWRFPIIFDQSTFAQQEISLYTRILAICEPLTILQWQLTSDYSILAGGGLFGNDAEDLRPTQRFWNLKQLAETPEGSYALPAESSSETVLVAALGETAKELYTLHIVNNGAERETSITGLSDDLTELHLYFTSPDHTMNYLGSVDVEDGSAAFILPAIGFASLYTQPIAE
jgi:hypothetical protein